MALPKGSQRSEVRSILYLYLYLYIGARRQGSASKLRNMQSQPVEACLVGLWKGKSGWLSYILNLFWTSWFAETHASNQLSHSFQGAPRIRDMDPLWVKHEMILPLGYPPGIRSKVITLVIRGRNCFIHFYTPPVYLSSIEYFEEERLLTAIIASFIKPYKFAGHFALPFSYHRISSE